MLGMAASNSIAAPMGPFRKLGETSVTKTAIPIATGMAKSRARNVVTAVPNRLVSAPNFSSTGSHSMEVMNSRTPNSEMAMPDSFIRAVRIPPTRATTTKAEAPVRRRNTNSNGSFFILDGNTLYPYTLKYVPRGRRLPAP